MDKCKSKILLIAQPGCGGGERMTILYGKILEKDGFGIDLELIKTKSDKNMSLLPFIPSHWHVNFDSCKFRMQIFRIYKYIRKSKPDVIFVSQGYYNLMVLALRKLRLISTKVIIRDNNMPSSHGKTQIVLSRILFPKADKIIAQTKEMKDEMVKFYNLKHDRITVINNPIDKDLILAKIKEDEIVKVGSPQYVFCGRISEQKDLKTLLNAFSIVKRYKPHANLWIIGNEGPKAYVESVYKLISSLSLKESVSLLGYQSNPYKYINAADVFVLSSVYEGLPNVLIEAMYLGKPVAVTESIPYISQIINNGQNGYISKIKDPQILASSMINACTIKELPKFVDVNHSEKLIVSLFK